MIGPVLAGQEHPNNYDDRTAPYYNMGPRKVKPSVTIPHSKTTGGRAEEAAVLRVVRSGFWGPGPEAARLEADLCRVYGRRHAVAVQSGSAALRLALLALGARPGRSVLIPAYTCAAVLNAVRQTGATPILVDVDEATFNMDPRAARRNALCAVVPHLFGCPAPIDEFATPVIEDCATAVGEGFGRRGVMVVGSFYATKLVAAGQGGFVAVDRADLAARLRDLVDYDKRDTDAVRFNDRMSDVTAALARVQLARASDFVKARRARAETYYEGCRGLPLALPPKRGHQFYRYVVRTPRADALLRHLASWGIESKRPVYRPLNRYLRLPGFPVAERVHRTSVSLPIYPTLSTAAQRRVLRSLRSFFASSSSAPPSSARTRRIRR